MTASKRIMMGLVLFQTLILFLPVANANQQNQEVRYYVEQKGAVKHEVRWHLTRSNGFDLTYEKETAIHITHTDDQLATLAWSMKDAAQDSDVRAKREQNDIIITGKFMGRTIDRRISIDEAPWFQATSLSLKGLAASQEKSMKFWTLRTDNLKAYKLKASKAGYEELPLNGKLSKMVKIELHLSGWLAPFWKSFYWFKADNGLFFRFEGPGDPYGKTQIIIEYTPATQLEKLSKLPPG